MALFASLNYFLKWVFLQCVYCTYNCSAQHFKKLREVDVKTTVSKTAHAWQNDRWLQIQQTVKNTKKFAHYKKLTNCA